MNRKHVFCLFVMSLCIAQTISAQAGDELMARLLTERPAGIMDGRNGTFILSRHPSPGSAIDLFNMGSPLRQGVDYSLIDRQIILSGSVIPKPNDILTAVYIPAADQGSTTLPNTKNTRRDVRAEGGDVIETFLWEAFRHELSLASRVPEAQIPLTVRMLQARSLGAPTKAHDNSQEPVHGLDGLGDRSNRSDTGSKFLDMLTERCGRRSNIQQSESRY